MGPNLHGCCAYAKEECGHRHPRRKNAEGMWRGPSASHREASDVYFPHSPERKQISETPWSYTSSLQKAWDRQYISCSIYPVCGTCYSSPSKLTQGDYNRHAFLFFDHGTPVHRTLGKILSTGHSVFSSSTEVKSFSLKPKCLTSHSAWVCLCHGLSVPEDSLSLCVSMIFLPVWYHKVCWIKITII